MQDKQQVCLISDSEYFTNRNNIPVDIVYYSGMLFNRTENHLI